MSLLSWWDALDERTVTVIKAALAFVGTGIFGWLAIGTAPVAGPTRKNRTQNLCAHVIFPLPSDHAPAGVRWASRSRADGLT